MESGAFPKSSVQRRTEGKRWAGVGMNMKNSAVLSQKNGKM